MHIVRKLYETKLFPVCSRCTVHPLTYVIRHWLVNFCCYCASIVVSKWSVDDVEGWLRSMKLKSEEELLTNLRNSVINGPPTIPPTDGKMMVKLANGWNVKEGKTIRAR
jgi:hypothetical protein